MEGTEREVVETAMEAGHILLENGAEIFRVEETINRVCRHYGVESCNAFVLSNGIFVTAGSVREEIFAKVQHIPVSGSHLNRVAAVNQLSREIAQGQYTIGEVRQRLDRMVIGSIIPLVPGVAFTNAIRDIADENYIAGSVRMMNALLVFFCIAMGVGLVYTVRQRLML